MKEEILKIIIEKNNITGGGTKVPDILILLKIDYLSIKEILSEMYKDKQITTKKGINGILIYPINKIQL